MPLPPAAPDEPGTEPEACGRRRRGPGRATLARLAVALLAAAWAMAAAAAERPVASVEALRAAVAAAEPGDEIVLEPGRYRLTEKISIHRPGERERPIVLRSREFGRAVIEVDTVEAFLVDAPYWRFEGLYMVGVCEKHEDCNHALHIVGHADGTVVRDSRLVDFNAQIKGNGTVGPGGGARMFPDDVVIERSALHNRTVRDTALPVTPVDVVGGARWRVRDNLFADFGKGAGNGVSYAAFLKGNSSDGILERNLVICTLRHEGGTRLGLSLGGGGTGQKYCTNRDCTYEHRRGIVRNNIVLHCPDDAGIYLNRALDAKVAHNTLFDTRGIEVRFPQSSAEVRNNVLTGVARARNGGRIVREGNLTGLLSEVRAWYRDPARGDFTVRPGAPLVDAATRLPEVSDDYCARPRTDDRPDAGAIEASAGPFCFKFRHLSVRKRQR